MQVDEIDDDIAVLHDVVDDEHDDVIIVDDMTLHIIERDDDEQVYVVRTAEVNIDEVDVNE